jgi:hypothetical protein
MEEALAAREKKAGIFEKVLANVSADVDAEQNKAEATQKYYLGKIEAHTAYAKHALSLDKLLGEKKVLLDEREWNLELREAALAELYTQGLNSQGNSDELMEFPEVQTLL